MPMTLVCRADTRDCGIDITLAGLLATGQIDNITTTTGQFRSLLLVLFLVLDPLHTEQGN